MDQKDIERSQHIKDSFSSLKENFVVLSKTDLELLLSMNKDHYYEYLSLLEVYLEKNREDETFILKDDPKQTFEDLTTIKTPREQAAIEAASAATISLEVDQIRDLTDSEYLALLQSQKDLECKEIITAATTPFISKIKAIDVVNQTFEYLELEKIWKQYGSPEDWKEVSNDGSVTYRFFNLKSLDVECTPRVEKDALETVKEDKFNIKYNR
jgi:hypothetical protein